MAATAADTIRSAAQAYQQGDEAALAEELHPNVRVVGSEWYDDWTGPEAAVRGMRGELTRHAAAREAGRTSLYVDGPLIDFDANPIGGADESETDGALHEVGDVAWWGRKDRLLLEGKMFDASWSVVLRNDDGNWRIVQSHFSIHR